MANQIAIAGALAGVCEALTYAKRAGLDPARVYETIRTGAARSGQLDIIAPKVLNGDFSAAFYLRHFVKDMGIASQECRTWAWSWRCWSRSWPTAGRSRRRLGVRDPGLIRHYPGPISMGVPVTGRFAPSPSGRMHLGNLWSSLLAWLAARSAGGRMVLRLEDLDPDHCTQAWV